MGKNVHLVFVAALLGLSVEALHLRRQQVGGTEHDSHLPLERTQPKRRNTRGLQATVDTGSVIDVSLGRAVPTDFVLAASPTPTATPARPLDVEGEQDEDFEIETGGPFVGPELPIDSEGRKRETSNDQDDLEEATKRIIGGHDAEPHSFHSMLLLKYGGGWRWAGCGGTLVSNCHVVTAAHCAADPSKPLGAVFVNAHRPYQENGDVPFHFSTVEHVTRHGGFNSTTNENDIAVIKMTQCLNTTEFPAAIPASPDMQIPSELVADILGFGKLSEQGNMFVNVETLQRAQVPVIPQDTCKQYYGDRIKEDMFCGGYSGGGVDACQGDSGSSMTFVREDGSTVLLGVISWGEGCGRAASPGVYASLQYHYDWLSRQVCEETDTNVTWCANYTSAPTPSPSIAATTLAPTETPLPPPSSGKSQKQRSSTTFYSSTPMLDVQSRTVEDTTSSTSSLIANTATSEHDPDTGMIQFWETSGHSSGCKATGEQCWLGSECCSGICQSHSSNNDGAQQSHSTCYSPNHIVSRKKKTRGVRAKRGNGV